MVEAGQFMIQQGRARVFLVSALALVSASPKRRLAELDNFYNPTGARKRAAG